MEIANTSMLSPAVIAADSVFDSFILLARNWRKFDLPLTRGLVVVDVVVVVVDVVSGLAVDFDFILLNNGSGVAGPVHCCARKVSILRNKIE